jgi:hypothetical protein
MQGGFQVKKGDLTHSASRFTSLLLRPPSTTFALDLFRSLYAPRST